MQPPNFNSSIKFIIEFFSELPPAVIAFLFGFGFFGLMVFCGYTLAFVVSFFVLAFTQNGAFIVSSFIACIGAFSIFGILKGYKMYKILKHACEQRQAG